ncbi:uncharacterized protein TNCV_3114031 [Trichonephila clavipes]|nr:uncharacterized protein TNCV_3114031 [Trichonephila clavipes]
MLNRIVTGDETWVFHITSESKQLSMELAAHILSRQGQNQTNAVKAKDYDNSVLGPVWCFAGVLYATRNNDKKCLLLNSVETPKSIAKQMLKWGSTAPEFGSEKTFPGGWKERGIAFPQRSSSQHLIEDETFNDSDVINNLIDYEDGQEESDSLRTDKNMQGFCFPTNWKSIFLK